MTPEPPEQRAEILEGTLQRVASELAQSRVTVAELDTRFQQQTAALVRAEAEIERLRAPAGDETT